MAIATTMTLVSLIIILAVCAGLIVLQVFLSKMESKWLGLMIPAITFLFSLLALLNMVAPSEGISIGFILQMLFAFLLANIPTLVLLAIYLACREKLRRKKQLDRMNIQDLD